MKRQTAWILFACWLLANVSCGYAQESQRAVPSPQPGPKPVALLPDRLEEDFRDREELGSRTALILIHGWNSSSETWGDVSWMFGPQGEALRAKYKTYRFTYQYKRNIESSGLALWNEIQKELGRSCKIAIVAHSMGGLVARSAIENVDGETSGLAERLSILITLGTPHHGTPMANLAWLQNYSFLEDADFLLFSGAWIGTKVNAIGGGLPIDTEGGYGLGWDNCDGKMPPKVLKGNFLKRIPAANGFTRELNRGLAGETAQLAKSKYFAIGSYHTYIPRLSLLNSLLKEKSNVISLVSRTILARSFQDENNRTLHDYAANDYIVPLKSSLFLEGGALESQLKGETVTTFPFVYNKYTLVRAVKVFEDIDHTHLTTDFEVTKQIAAWLTTTAPPEETPAAPLEEIPTIPQTVSAPVLLIDRSGSIVSQPGAMQQVQQRAGEVVRAIQNNVSQAAVINFSGSGNCAVDADFTRDATRLLNAIKSPSIGNNGTAIYDAVAAAVNVAIQHREQAMLILFTDGYNNAGSGLSKAIEYCKQKNVPVVVVGFTGTQGRKDDDLRILAGGTGGFYVLNEETNINDILHRFNMYSTAKRGGAPRDLPN